MNASFKLEKNAFVTWMKQRVRAPEAKIKGFFARELYPFYQEKQMRRWETEGESEGGEYGFRKASKGWREKKELLKLKYPSRYPGGDKRLTFTGKLASSVIGVAGKLGTEGLGYHRKGFSSNKMYVVTTLPYASRVIDWQRAGGKKSFMKFSPKTHREFRERIREFLKKEFT